MLCLGLEAATLSPGIGLASEAGILWRLAEARPKSKAQAIFVYLDRAMGEGRLDLAGLDLIAVTAGPGSFTGLKVGLTTAKTLAWSLNKPCAAVSSLKALAASAATQEGLIAPLLDARRGMVYCALFRSSGLGLERLAEDQVRSPEEWSAFLAQQAAGERLKLTGGGLGAYSEVFDRALPGAEKAAAEEWLIDPGQVARLGLDILAGGGSVSALELKANYIRPPDAKLPPQTLYRC